MKQLLKTLLILLLFQMIVLPTISQIKYQTENDTLICYTKEDNRLIAIMLKEGEISSELNIINDTIISTLNANIVEYKKLANLMNTQIDTLKLQNKTLLYNKQILSIENNRLTEVNKQWKFATFVSSTLSIGLIILIVLL